MTMFYCTILYYSVMYFFYTAVGIAENIIDTCFNCYTIK